MKKAHFKIIEQVIDALIEKEYNPYEQLYGYLMYDFPRFITTHKDARKLIQMVDSNDISEYLKDWEKYQDKKWKSK